MLQISLEKMLQNTSSKNPHTFAKRINLVGHAAYRFASPSQVKGLQLTTLSNIAVAIAEEKGISPLDVKMGDIFDWES